MKRLFALPAFVLPLVLAGAAHAQDPAPPPVAPPPAPTVNPDSAPPPAAETSAFKQFTLTANPLSIAVGRYSANFEYLPAQHHAIVVNPYFWHLSASGSAGNASASTSYNSFGGELGYHFYTGTRGASGFFIGPSLVVMNTSISSSASASGSSNSGSTSTFAYGGALDLGGQFVAENGFTIGGGAGVMWLTSSSSADTGSSSFKVSGTLPRVLFTVGYSF